MGFLPHSAIDDGTYSLRRTDKRAIEVFCKCYEDEQYFQINHCQVKYQQVTFIVWYDDGHWQQQQQGGVDDED
jgi:hypothetical protein